MRFGLAIASLVISGILLLLGLGQRTVFAGPDEIVYSASTAAQPEAQQYAVITADQFSAVPGQANLMLGGTDSFAALGSRADVEAWVAPLAHVDLVADAEKKQLRSDPVAAQSSDLNDAQVQALDPRGSDLWLSEQGSGRVPVSLADDQAMLVRVGGGDAVSVIWSQDDRTPWAGPLLVAGGVFALIGLLLYLLAVDHNRRGLGPRRGRSGPLIGIRNMLGGSKGSTGTKGTGTPGPKRSGAAKFVAAPVLGLAALLALSGCSANYWPEIGARPAADQSSADDHAVVAPVPILQAQIDRIVENVASVAGEGDDALDAKVLASRFSGDALEQRTAHYKIRSKVSDYEVVLPRITAKQLDYELVQSTEGWPRTVFATVASEAPEPVADKKADKKTTATSTAAEEPQASPSLAMILTQSGPHENYHVTRIFALRGGISMPAAAPAEEGTALLPDDLKTLALPPAQVGADYAKVLAGGTGVAQAVSFDLTDDTIIAKSGAAWVAAAKKSARKDKFDVKYSVTAAQTSTAITSLSTGVGGALVATTVLESRIEKQAGKYQPKAVGAVTALSKLKGAQKRIVSKVSHQLLFFVPSDASGEKIHLLGYTTELVGASK